MTDTGARALVVEDDRSWQQILGEILGDAGLVVDTAASVEEAVESLRAAPHRLAVVDLSLGGADHHNQDGLQVLDAVRLHDPGCVSLLLTGYATVELAVSALTEHGAFTCLRKEAFRRRQFRDEIDRALSSARLPPERPQGGPGPLPAGNSDVAEPAASGAALVVEDDAGWRNILSELLCEMGYRVRLAASYGQARGYLRRGKYAVAVVDLSLAGAAGPSRNLDGYRLLAAIRTARVPAIVVSGIATPGDIERAYAEQGVFACLEKQAFDRQDFRRLVEEAVEAGAGDGCLASLTGRERQVLDLLARGRTNKEIAEALVITGNTVKRHLKAIFDKLGVHTRSAAAARAVGAGLPSERERGGS